MTVDLVQVHHAAFQRDIPFWVHRTEGRDPILEVGCGHGRVTLPLIEKGRRVVGVDHDPAVLETILERLTQHPEQLRSRLELVEQDILQFDPEIQFGAVLIPCNTLTTFPVDKRQELYSRLADLLVEGGLLIASMPNPVLLLKVLEDLQNSKVEPQAELEEIFFHPETGFPVQVSSRMKAQPDELVWEWIYDHLHPDGEVDRVVVSSQHYPAASDSYITAVSQAGFRSVECLGDYDGSRYGENSPEMILVAGR